MSYTYLWARERAGGSEEGRKVRPCMIVAVRNADDRTITTIVPITHLAPALPGDAVELPAPLKRHLSLDDEPSWVMVTETNDFVWPGPDLRPVPGCPPGTFHYGMVPPRFFAHVRDMVLQAHTLRTLTRTVRSE